EKLARNADLDAGKQLPLWYFLVHMVTHSQQHRSESAQLLTQLGRSPGDVDFLDYCDEHEVHLSSR
ncbi:MAG: DinB family protein, partial [Candidatus Limnocylindria bacterium]